MMRVKLFNIDILRNSKLKKGVTFIVAGTMLFSLSACSLKKTTSNSISKTANSILKESSYSEIIEKTKRYNAIIKAEDLINVLMSKLEYTENDILNDREFYLIVEKIQNAMKNGEFYYDDLSNGSKKCLEIYYRDGNSSKKVGWFYNIYSFNKQVKFIQYESDGSMLVEHYSNNFNKDKYKSFRYSDSNGNMISEITKKNDSIENYINIDLGNLYISVREADGRNTLVISSSKDDNTFVYITKEEYNELYAIMNSYYGTKNPISFIGDNRDSLIKYLSKFHSIIDKQKYFDILCAIYEIAENVKDYSKSM